MDISFTPFAFLAAVCDMTQGAVNDPDCESYHGVADAVHGTELDARPSPTGAGVHEQMSHFDSESSVGTPCEKLSGNFIERQQQKEEEKQEKLLTAFQDCKFDSFGELIKCAGPIIITQKIGFLQGPPKRNGAVCTRNQGCGSGNCMYGFCQACDSVTTRVNCNSGNSHGGEDGQAGGCSWMPFHNNCAHKPKVRCEALSGDGCKWPQYNCNAKFTREDAVCKVGCDCVKERRDGTGPDNWGNVVSWPDGNKQCWCNPSWYVAMKSSEADDEGRHCEGTSPKLDGKCEPRRCSAEPNCPWGETCNWDNCDWNGKKENPAWPSGCDYRLEEAAKAMESDEPINGMTLLSHMNGKYAEYANMTTADGKPLYPTIAYSADGKPRATYREGHPKAGQRYEGSKLAEALHKEAADRVIEHGAHIARSEANRHLANLKTHKARWYTWANDTAAHGDDHHERIDSQHLMHHLAHEVFLAGHPDVWDLNKHGKPSEKANAEWPKALTSLVQIYKKLGLEMPGARKVPKHMHETVSKGHWRQHLHGAVLDHLIDMTHARRHRETAAKAQARA